MGKAFKDEGSGLTEKPLGPILRRPVVPDQAWPQNRELTQTHDADEGGWMPQRAVIAGWWCGCVVVALGFGPGCAGARHRRDQEESPAATVMRQELSQAATAAMDRGDFPQARTDLEQLVGQTPRSAEIHYRLGKVLQLQGDLAAAGESFHKALAIEPEYVSALVGLGQVDAQARNSGEALTRFDTAIELEPNQAEAHFARGEALEALGRPDDALAAYFRSLEINPGSAPALFRVATLQLRRSQPDQALVRLERANELAPDDAEIRFRRGQAHLALNHHRLAVEDLTFAAEKLGERSDVLLGLAQALESDRQPAQAKLAAERVLRLDPASTIARDLTTRLQR